MNTRYRANGPAGQLLTGHVMHERLRPAHHAFTYPLFQVYCDIGRLDSLARWWFGVDRWRLLGIDSRDYGPRDGSPLEPWMRERLLVAGIPADGAIWLQTIPRILGYAFNPVSFWYCHDRNGQLRALYADVRNTFGSHHGYLLSSPGHAPICNDTVLICRKSFHVSPFCGVEGDYAFRVRRQRDHITVAIDYCNCDGLLLRTAIGMRGEPLTGLRACRALIIQPLNALNVVVRIHWQALRLWLKRVPFHGKTPPMREHAAPQPFRRPADANPSTHRSTHRSTHSDHKARP
jgi:DUF1365 family protein